jgi:hypothetical protein
LLRGQRGARRADGRRVTGDIVHMPCSGARGRDCPAVQGSQTTTIASIAGAGRGFGAGFSTR